MYVGDHELQHFDEAVSKETHVLLGSTTMQMVYHLSGLELEC